MGSEVDEFSSLVERIYSAALVPVEWNAVLPETLRFIGTSRGIIGIESSSKTRLEVNTQADIDPELFAVWHRDFDGFDPVYDRIGVPPVGSVFRSWSVVPRDEVHATDLYQACYGPMGADDHLVAILGTSGEGGSFLTAFRGEAEDPFTDADERRLGLLAPHLRQAVRICRALSRAAGARNAVLEALPYGAALIDDNRRVTDANLRFEAIVRANDGLSVRRNQLVATKSGADETVSAAIRGAIQTTSGRGGNGGTLLRVTRDSERRPYEMLVIPIPPPRNAAPLAFVGAANGCLILVNDPGDTPRPRAEVLRSLFGLTPALSKLAAALASGSTVAEYAEGARVTQGTARQQLKQLFARTETKRQTELVSLILSSVARAHDSR